MTRLRVQRSCLLLILLLNGALLAHHRGVGAFTAPGQRAGLLVYTTSDLTPEFTSMQIALRKSTYFKDHGHELYMIDIGDEKNSPEQKDLVAKYQPQWSAMHLPALIVTDKSGNVVGKSEPRKTEDVYDGFRKAGGG